MHGTKVTPQQKHFFPHSIIHESFLSNCTHCKAKKTHASVCSSLLLYTSVFLSVYHIWAERGVSDEAAISCSLACCASTCCVPDILHRRTPPPNCCCTRVLESALPAEMSKRDVGGADNAWPASGHATVEIVSCLGCKAFVRGYDK